MTTQTPTKPADKPKIHSAPPQIAVFNPDNQCEVALFPI